MSSYLPSSEILFADKANASNLEQAREIQIMFEYQTLVNYLPQGMFVVPAIRSLHLWHGIVFIRSGIYQGGVFRFTIEIPVNYPLAAPKIVFCCSIFHPLINQDTGELNLNSKFCDWRPKKDFIFMVLRYVKSIFHQKELVVDKKYVMNKTAFQLLHHESEYQDQVNNCINSCMEVRHGVSSYLKINPNGDEHDSLQHNFKEISDEDHVDEFMDWFKSRYNCQE